jgi:hypothetical protein
LQLYRGLSTSKFDEDSLRDRREERLVTRLFLLVAGKLLLGKLKQTVLNLQIAVFEAACPAVKPFVNYYAWTRRLGSG